MNWELPSVAAWKEWRASLPAVPHGAPGLHNTLMEIQRHTCGLCLNSCCCLVVDHDHDTGLVRGLLCRSCNNHEGRSHSPLLSAYRANPPAAGAGWIWDALGSVGRVMLAREKAAGNGRRGRISCIAPADLLVPQLPLW